MNNTGIKVLSDKQFTYLRELVYNKTHIKMNESKRVLLSNRLRKRLLSLNLHDFDIYIDYLNDESNHLEMERFLEVVTTNETYFYRDPDDFKLLSQEIIPQIISKYPEVKVLSAGSSTGEESYEIAMTLEDLVLHEKLTAYTIEAMDISERVVKSARKGVYSKDGINRLPTSSVRKFFVANPEDEETLKISDNLRERVHFRKGDLFSSDLPKSQIIFCRNVMIYYTREDRELLVKRFYDALVPGGFLILGSSENLFGFHKEFKVHTINKNTYYEKL